MTAAISHLASSLAQDEIPVKLRCASCNNLATNAFKLPCCDQVICESCQGDLPQACPVCSHSPLSKDDCKPNKSLRLTIKAFLKSEEKKREKLKAGVVASETPAPPAVSTSQGPQPTAPTYAEPSTRPAGEDAAANGASAGDIEGHGDEFDATSEGAQVKEAPADDIEIGPQTVKDDGHAPDSKPETPDAGGDDALSAPDGEEARPKGQEENTEITEDITSKDQSHGYGQSQMNGDGNLNVMNGFGNSIGNQNWGMGNMNPMMAMQNGMGGWGGFPNMMGMDPMMLSQGMYGGFNGQGMGMNGMNMGMGFDGGYGGWGDQSAMGAGGGMNGNFGCSNAGYFPGGGGYNNRHQGHFNQMHNQQFQNNRFQGRFNSQRGGFGRDLGRQYSGQGQFGSANPSMNGGVMQSSQSPALQDDGATATHTAVENDPSANETVQTSIEHSDSQGHTPGHGDIKRDTDSERVPKAEDSEGNQTGLAEYVEAESAVDATGAPIESAIETMSNNQGQCFDHQNQGPATLGANVPLGPAARYGYGDGGVRGRGSFRGRGLFDPRGGMRGRGDFAPVAASMPSPVEPKGVGVVGAPTGPKALREGLPNTGFRGRANFPAVGRGRGAPAGMNGRPLMFAESTSVEPQSTRPLSRSKTPPESQHGQSKQYSASEHEGHDSEHERSREQRRRRSRKYDEKDDPDNGRDSRRAQSGDDDSKHRSRHGRDEHRSSRRDHDGSRERRRRRHRSRSAGDKDDDRHADVEGKRDSDRHRDRHRDRDEDRGSSRRHSKRDRSATPSRDEGRDHESSRRHKRREEAAPGAVPTGPREFKIQGRSKRTELEVQKEIVKEEKPNLDPHALEREARNRVRMVKEQQRRGSYQVGNERKRSRPSVDEINGVLPSNGGGDHRSSRRKVQQEDSDGGRARKVSYKYDDEETGEARAARIENEREAARWD